MFLRLFLLTLPLRTLWLPKHTDPQESDLHYLEMVIDDVIHILAENSSKISHLNVVGFSNGGFMAADLALSVFPGASSSSSVVKLFPETVSENVCVAQTLVGPDWRDT